MKVKINVVKSIKKFIINVLDELGAILASLPLQVPTNITVPCCSLTVFQIAEKACSQQESTVTTYMQPTDNFKSAHSWSLFFVAYLQLIQSWYIYLIKCLPY